MVAPVVLGRDPLDAGALTGAVTDATLKFPGSFVCRALCGVETACWDLRGKLEQKLVYELLGGSARSLSAYGSSMRRDISPEDEANRLRTLRDERGFRAFKIRVGSPAGHNRDASPGRTEAIIPRVRESLGDEIVIHADANSCYTPDEAIRVGRLLETYNYGHFEEPCPYWELDWTRQVTEALEMPVAGGEQDNSWPVWQRMVRESVVDIVQPDVCYIGGISRALAVAELAADAGLPCTPHSANHSMVTVFTMHLLASIPNAGPFFEYSIEDQGQFQEIFEPRLDVHDGVVSIPNLAYGWGVEPKEAWMAKSVYQVSELE
jgi:L-alanine-DL-glutamate epimerase-like enolase superfamily enzyme